MKYHADKKGGWNERMKGAAWKRRKRVLNVYIHAKYSIQVYYDRRKVHGYPQSVRLQRRQKTSLDFKDVPPLYDPVVDALK